MPIDALRTPEDRFGNLPDWPYAPHAIEDLPAYEGLRIAYVDEGPKDAEQTFLCLHGQPTWSYLYRKMIPVFLGSGARVIAPDWLGFGRSDKPVEDEVYTFGFHRGMIMAFIERLELSNMTLVCQDWGGIIGLTLPPDMPNRFTRLLVMNTALAVGAPPSDGFMAWKAFNASQPDLDVTALMQRATPGLSDAEAAAYAAPFPDKSYKAGVRRFPELVMVSPEMEGVDASKRAAAWWRDEWDGKSFMAVGAQDPVLGPTQMEQLRSQIRGCPEAMLVPEAGHFVQEHGREIAEAALAAWSR
ncbi:MAG: haloalkane dehalogenase [Pseudomonadota bacterium]